jgi:hypothetical protein
MVMEASCFDYQLTLTLRGRREEALDNLFLFFFYSGRIRLQGGFSERRRIESDSCELREIIYQG